MNFKPEFFTKNLVNKKFIFQIYNHKFKIFFINFLMCFLLIFGSKNSFSFPNITSNIPNNINNSPNSQNNIDYCQNTKIYHPFIFEEIKKGNNEILAQIPNCFKSDRKLFLQLVKIDFSFFSEANEELKQDLNFIKKVVKI